MARTMIRAVSTSLKTLDDQSRDAGAVALCRRYAMVIDNATLPTKLKKLLSTVAAGLDPDDEEANEALEKVAAVLTEHSVASDIGPKLLAALTALGLTPAGRGGAKDGGGNEPARTSLDELRERRARKSRAANLDATAT